jgi:hypothetical protein
MREHLLEVKHKLINITIGFIDKNKISFREHFVSTVDPVYSSLGYSEYPLIVNGFLRTDR